MIGTVQALRIIAAVMVLLSHVQHEIVERSFLATSGYKPWEPVFLPGGVDIFFVISGFIMFRISRNSFGRPGQPALFLLRRIARVAPAYWFFTAAMVLAILMAPGVLAHAQLTPSWVALSALFLPSPDPYGRFYPVLRLGWTLNFEVLFYMMFAVALLFERRRGIIVLIAGLMTLALCGYFQTAKRAPFAFWCDPIVLEFLMGVAVAHAHAQGWKLRPPSSAALVVAAVASMVTVKLLGVAGHHWELRFLWMGVPAVMLCAGLVLGTDIPEGSVKRAVVFGGDLSFALYLSHPFTINAVLTLFKLTGLRQAWLCELACFALSILVAGAFFVFAERPTNRYLTRRIEQRFSSRRAVTQTAA
ncbi:MAG: hypothetical protein JWN04_1006 [Myxococcaceae bacterium]|nr:hypothetical protein [Myxococcaceae bacterium]